MIKRITNAPSWLGLSLDRTSFVCHSDRAEIVRQIFQFSIDGFGAYSIAKLLNKKGVPGFGSSKKWDKSTILNMLTNRATIGEYQKRRRIEGKKVIVGEPVPNYYPAVIDAKTFEAAQVALREKLANRSGRRGKVITNLFFGVASCFYCSQTMKFYNNNNKSLICSEVLSGQGKCPRFAWTYQDFEDAFFDTLNLSPRCSEFSAALLAFRNAVEQNNEPGVLDARMRMTQILRRSIEGITIAAAGTNPPAPSRRLIIRRDNPGRFFKVKFADGFSLEGFPRLLETPPQTEPEGRIISPDELARLFGLSPRQAQITSFLVQGFSLKQTAEKVGQTIETARWHLREIFRRTDTHSQSKLIELVDHSCPEMNLDR